MIRKRLKWSACLWACVALSGTACVLAWPNSTRAQADAPQTPTDATEQAGPTADAPDDQASDTPDDAETETPDEPATDTTDAADPTDQGEATPGSRLAKQIQLMAELASAYRLRDELDAALNADGTANGQNVMPTDTRLAGLATRSGVLANSAANDQARVVLWGCQARANAALAQVQGSEQARLRRLQQMRSAAGKMRALDVPNAMSSGDYWLLLADLADASRLSATVDARQALARELLAGYIEAYAQDEHANDYVLDARLSLARLLDDRGDQQAVAEQIKAIGELPGDSPRAEQVAQLRASVARIGQAIDIEALTTRVGVWNLSDFAGQPVLLHVYADTLEHSVAMIDPIKRAIAANKLDGAAVVSLRVGDPVEGAPAAPWPTLPMDLEPGGVLDQLGIAALPALVWIDQSGKVASIGHTAAVLDHMPADQPAEPHPRDDGQAEPLDEAEAQAEPAPARPLEGDEKLTD